MLQPKKPWFEESDVHVKRAEIIKLIHDVYAEAQAKRI
jgi:hypothetical protein